MTDVPDVEMSEDLPVDMDVDTLDCSIHESSTNPEELGAVTSDNGIIHQSSAMTEELGAVTSDNSKMHQPSANPAVPAAEGTSVKNTEGIRFTASVEWSDKDGLQKNREKKTKDLQKALQSWLNKNKENVTCSVLSVAEDGRAEIMIQNDSALDETVMQNLTLTFKDQTAAIIKNFSPSESKPETQITDRKPVDAPSPLQSAPQDVKVQGFGTAGPGTESCTLPLFHFWYVSQAYQEEMRRIERENEVEIIANVNVSFKAKEGTRGDTNNALLEFTNVVQKCLGDSQGSTFPLKRADPEALKDTLKITQSNEAKLVFSVSSNEITVFGPSKSREAVNRLLNGSKTTLTNDLSFGASAWGSQDTSQKIGRSIKDPLVSAGLTMDESHWKVMTDVFDKKIAYIKTKFDVWFEPRVSSQGKVTVRARTQNAAAAESLESHALRALLSLYQKVATSTMSCSLLVPDQTPEVESKLGVILSKHPGIDAGGNSGTWRITGLPETLGPAVDELEKILGGRVLKEEDKQRIQYLRYPMSNFGAAMEGGATAGGTTGENKEEETCPICMDPFTKKKKIKCAHEFCEECLERSVKSLGPICPICKAVFGKVEGNQPEGKMSWIVHHYPLSGFPNCNTIAITYNIPSGIQTERHPNPGKPYQGVTRTAYLPDNKEGREVLTLLSKAFDQKLIFTVGTSRTTGADNQVTWNDIHHKTSTYGGPVSFGYPDPGYLSRVREELKAKGIE